jgi:hypothetical protein
MIPAFPATIKDGKVHIGNKRVFDAYISGLKYSNISVVIKKRTGKQKTLSQLGLYYGLWIPIIKDELIRENGEDSITVNVAGFDEEVLIDKDFVDDFLKKHCARIDEDEVLRIATANDKREVHLKRNMSKMEAMMFLNNVKEFCARDLHITLPEISEQ